MSVVPDAQSDLGGAFDGAPVPEHYGRPERTHRAVRNGVGVTEMAYGVLELTGPDRVPHVDEAVTAPIPEADAAGGYALLLDPEGRIEADLYAYSAGDRLLVFLPRAVAPAVADRWRARAAHADRSVTVRTVTDEFGVFGVHGPQATEKIASILHGASAPDRTLSFVRGETADHGVTVIRTDAPTGEEGYEVVCRADAAARVFDGLLTRGLNAVPFGRRTWRDLTLEAGTPLFENELRGRRPGDCGAAGAVEAHRAFPGRRAVGDPNRRLVGLRPDALPAPGTTVRAGEQAVGEVTRAAASPMLDAPIAFAVVERTAAGPFTVRVEGEAVPARSADLPFVEGSERSGRLPIETV